MGKPGFEDLERALIISNKSHGQRMERIEQNIKQLSDTMLQSNQVLRKVYDEMEAMQKRISEIEEFANQIIEANRAASVLFKSVEKKNESDLS